MIQISEGSRLPLKKLEEVHGMSKKNLLLQPYSGKEAVELNPVGLHYVTQEESWVQLAVVEKVFRDTNTMLKEISPDFVKIKERWLLPLSECIFILSRITSIKELKDIQPITASSWIENKLKLS